ncbi:MAG: 2TM domain-containing protein [Dehalococcoidia bacterium]
MREQDDAYRRAKLRVKQIRVWIILGGIYAVMIPVFFFIDITTGGGIEWAHWATLGCLLGFAIHTGVVWAPAFGRQWEDRKIRELMEREGSDAVNTERADTIERP